MCSEKLDRHGLRWKKNPRLGTCGKKGMGHYWDWVF